MKTTNCSFINLLMNSWISRQFRILADLMTFIILTDRSFISFWKICQNIFCRVSWSLYCLQSLLWCNVLKKSCSMYRFCSNEQIVASAQLIISISQSETCWIIILQKLKLMCNSMNERREKIDDIESRNFCMIE